jgi:ubiquinone/menaquinone biosynthesis C-methylase UbiE
LTERDEKGDRYFLLFFNDNPFRRIFFSPGRLVKPFVATSMVVADLGCGPGFFTVPLAQAVGEAGKVYAVDFDEKAVRAVERKARKRGLGNIEARVSSASELGFIADESVDFVFAHGLLCAMAPQKQEAAVREIRRILKPGARAYLSAAKGPWSHVDGPTWEELLAGFRVERRGEEFSAFGHRWAIVSKS